MTMAKFDFLWQAVIDGADYAHGQAFGRFWNGDSLFSEHGGCACVVGTACLALSEGETPYPGCLSPNDALWLEEKLGRAQRVLSGGAGVLDVSWMTLPGLNDEGISREDIAGILKAESI